MSLSLLLRLLPYLAHLALGVWALQSWIQGPFQGMGVIDGAEILELATGESLPFATKSPLYPWLLSHWLELCSPINPAYADARDIARWVGALGILVSLGVLHLIGMLARELTGRMLEARSEWPGCDTAIPARWLYVISGSSYAFLVQPLPTVLASLCLAWLVWITAAALGRNPSSPSSRANPAGWQIFCGGFAGAALFATRASLLPVVICCTFVWISKRKIHSQPVKLLALGLGIGLLCFGGLFGSGLLPEAGELNLRLGNGAARSGMCDARPGPVYEQTRADGWFLAEEGHSPGKTQLRLLSMELRADPVGALKTLARKAWLLGHRTEVQASADFRHGLRDFWLLPVLLQSWALILPLALAGWSLWRKWWKWPVLGVLAANVIFLTSARYRFPALPLLAAAAGATLTLAWMSYRRSSQAQPGAQSFGKLQMAVALACAVLFIPNWAQTALTFPGDGQVQSAYLAMSQDSHPPAALADLERALELGCDPRAAYLLGLWHERKAQAEPGQALTEEQAEAMGSAASAYEQALALSPSYPEAAENLLRVRMLQGDDAAAEKTALELFRREPRGALLALNLSTLWRKSKQDPVRERAMYHEGVRLLELRRLAQGQTPRP